MVSSHYGFKKTVYGLRENDVHELKTAIKEVEESRDWALTSPDIAPPSMAGHLEAALLRIKLVLKNNLIVTK